MDLDVGPVLLRCGRLGEPRRRDGVLGAQGRAIEGGGGDAGVAPVDQHVPQHVAAVGVAVHQRARHPRQRARDRGIGPPGQQRSLGGGELPFPGPGPAAPHGDQRAVAQRRPPRRVDDGHAARPSSVPVRVHRGQRAPHRVRHRVGGPERRPVVVRQHQPVRADGERARRPVHDGDRAHGGDLDRSGRLEHDGSDLAADGQLHPFDGGGHVPAGQRRAADDPDRRGQPSFEDGQPGGVRGQATTGRRSKT